MLKVNRRHTHGNSNLRNLSLSLNYKQQSTEPKTERKSILKKIPLILKSKTDQQNCDIKLTNKKSPIKNHPSENQNPVNFYNLPSLEDGLSIKPQKKQNFFFVKNSKIEINKKAGLETQLIYQNDYAIETPENEFNLKKVIDFKSSLSRRYSQLKKSIGGFRFLQNLKNQKIDKEGVHFASRNLSFPLNNTEVELFLRLFANKNKTFITANNFNEMIYENDFQDFLGIESDKLKYLENGKEIFDFIDKKIVQFSEFKLKKTLALIIENELSKKNKVNLFNFYDFEKLFLSNQNNDQKVELMKIAERFSENGKIDLNFLQKNVSVF